MAVSSGALRSLFVEVRAKVAGAIAGLGAVDEAGDRAAGSLSDAEQSAEALTRRSRMLRGGLIAAGLATGALAVGMGKIAAGGMRVDSVLKTVEATTGSTKQQMAAIRDEVNQLGIDLPLTALDSAQAFRELSYAGLTVKESIAALGDVGELATASTLSVSDAARTTTSALNAFNLEADQAGSVANSLAAVFASSASTIPELSQALEYVGGAANTAGQDITEVTAALGVLADRGYRSSKAGTGLQQLFSSIADPSSSAADSLESLGLSSQSFLDQQGDFRDLNEIIAILGSRLEGLPEGEQLAALTSIFGERGARAVAPLVEDVDSLRQKIAQVAAADLDAAIEDLGELSSTELETLNQTVAFDVSADMSREDVLRELQSLSGEMSESELATQIQVGLDVDQSSAEILAGDIASGKSIDQLASALDSATTSGELAQAKMETVSGKLEYLSGSIDAISQNIYGGFKPALNAILDGLIPISDALSENEGAARAFGAGLAVLLGILTTTTLALGAMAVETWAVGTAQSAAAKSTLTHRAAQLALGTATKAATGAQWLLTASLADLRAALGATRAAQLASTASTWSLSGAATALSTSLKGAAASAYGLLTALGPIGWLAIAVGAGIAAVATNAFGARDALNNLLEPVGGIEGALDAAGDAASWAASGFMTLVQTGGSLLGAGLLTFFGVLRGAIGGTIDFVGGLINYFDSLSTAGKIALAPLMPLAALLWGIGEGAQWAADHADDLGGVLAAVGQGWNALTSTVGGTVDEYLVGPIGDVEEALASTERYLGVVHGMAVDTANDVRRFFELLETSPDTAIEFAQDEILPSKEEVREGSYKFLKNFSTGGDEDYFKDFAPNFIEDVEGVIETIRKHKPALRRAGEGFMGWLEGFASGGDEHYLENFAPNFIADVQDSISDIVGFMDTVGVDEYLENFATGGHEDYLEDFAPNFIEDVQSGASEVMDFVGSLGLGERIWDALSPEAQGDLVAMDQWVGDTIADFEHLAALDLGHFLSDGQQEVLNDLAADAENLRESLTVGNIGDTLAEQFPRAAAALDERTQDAAGALSWLDAQADGVADTFDRVVASPIEDTLADAEGYAEQTGDGFAQAREDATGFVDELLSTDLPEVTHPDLRWPTINAPALPDLRWPDIDAPETPDLSAPDIPDLPSLPPLDVPGVDLPDSMAVADDVYQFGAGLGEDLASALVTGLDVTLAALLDPEDMVPAVASYWYDEAIAAGDQFLAGVESWVGGLYAEGERAIDEFAAGIEQAIADTPVVGDLLEMTGVIDTQADQSSPSTGGGGGSSGGGGPLGGMLGGGPVLPDVGGLFGDGGDDPPGPAPIATSAAGGNRSSESDGSSGGGDMIVQVDQTLDNTFEEVSDPQEIAGELGSVGESAGKGLLDALRRETNGTTPGGG